LILGVLASLAFTQAQTDALARARQLYNTGAFTESIAAAEDARKTPAHFHPATTVLARALLERYRLAPDVADLDRARALLKTIDPSRLTPRDRVELWIALGVAVFLEGEALRLTDRYGAAAVFFDTALAHAEVLEGNARNQLFEWWASALDRQAQFGPDTDRRATYQRIVDRADRERAQHPETAASAMYWQAAASRGAGDLERAWSSGIATWILAGTMGERGVALRQDVDELMLDVILRERARALMPTGDPLPVYQALVNQWEETKKRWQLPAAATSP
jgi:hypothetical protein